MGAKAGTCGLPSVPPGAGVKPEPGVLGVLSMFGSSLLLAREANIFIDDSSFATQLRARLEHAICNGASELRATDWRRLSMLQRALNWVSYQLVRLAIGLAGYGDKH